MISRFSWPHLWRTAFWALVAVTLWMSLVPVDQIPSTFHFWDKAQHALGFTALTGLGLLAYPARQGAVLCGLLLLGAGIECAQAMTGWRQGDWHDWVADVVGIALGAAGQTGYNRSLARRASVAQTGSTTAAKSNKLL